MTISRLNQQNARMIYLKTERGQSVMQDRSSGLLPRQRSAFIMFDGKRSSEEVLKATAGLGVTPDDLEQLVALGLLKPVNGAPAPLAVTEPMPLAPAAPLKPVQGSNAAPTMDAQAQFLKAWPIATRLTARLGLRGFRLNLAVESAGDLAKLKELAPRIKEAVGAEAFAELEKALYH
jgi:hypothetical protein